MLNVIKRTIGLEKKESFAAPSSEMFALFGHHPTSAGVSVTPQTAMQCPAVYACVKVLAESVAQLPLDLFEREGDAKRKASGHPLFEVLHHEPNPWTSSVEFREAMMVAVLLHGNAFAHVTRQDGQVVELIQIPSECVTVEADRRTMEPVYSVKQGEGPKRVYSHTEIFHLRGLSSGLTGVSPIRQAAEAIGLALSMERHAGRVFGLGARPAGVFKYPGALQPEQVQRLKDSLSKAHSGPDGSGGTLVLESGMDFQQAQFSSVDLQFLELRRHQVAEIARVFRVPLSLLQDLERVTHANAESLGQQFLSLTLLPWLRLWEATIRRSLLSPEEKGRFFAEFNTSDLVSADLAARFEAYTQAVTNGILNPNEVRAMENRSPYEGGDTFMRPLNTGEQGSGDEDA